MNGASGGPLAGECLEYLVVDVFVAADGPAGPGGPAGQPFTGNPLAVVLGGDQLSTGQCQLMAREFHLSETVFAMAPTVAEADYRARIFTITSELPFAGHPSVGVAWVLRRLGRLKAGHVRQECGVGLVTLDVPTDGEGALSLTGPVPATSEPVDPAPLLAAVGLTADDLAGPPPRIGGSGVSFAYLSVRPGALATAGPNLTALAGLTAAVTGVLVFTVADTGSSAGPPTRLDIRARMFAADIGGEDPATGSAALGLGGWLVVSGVAAANGETAYAITQGVEMGRPSLLLCDVTTRDSDITRVRVSGRVTAVASGRIRVP